uniref:uncharacterized protein LOC120339950 n=1 Tax=Styela clava TaxID=7725 RepID=UPI0019393779|nr:uncharacterized protein LOC120339950 [Styela clava]
MTSKLQNIFRSISNVNNEDDFIRSKAFWHPEKDIITSPYRDNYATTKSCLPGVSFQTLAATVVHCFLYGKGYNSFRHKGIILKCNVTDIANDTPYLCHKIKILTKLFGQTSFIRLQGSSSILPHTSTKFHSLNLQILKQKICQRYARSIETVTIRSRGGRICFDGCTINIPAGALTKPTKLEFELRIMKNKYFKDYFSISPSISQNKPGVKFLKPIRIELPTWCYLEPHHENSLIVLHNSHNDIDWRDTQMAAVFKDSKIIVEVTDFSSYVVVIWRKLLGRLRIPFKLKTMLFHQNYTNFAAICGFDSQIITKEYTDNFNMFGWKSVFPQLDSFRCLMGDKICIKLSSTTPGVLFDPLLGHYFTVDTEDYHTKYFARRMEEHESKCNTILLDYSVLNAAKEELLVKSYFNIPSQNKTYHFNAPNRMEDAYRAVCKRFHDASTFKMFAIYRHGLRLDYHSVKIICDSHPHFNHDAMVDVFELWKQRNQGCSPSMLINLVDNYFTTNEVSAEPPTFGREHQNTQNMARVIFYTATFCAFAISLLKFFPKYYNFCFVCSFKMIK